MRSDWTNYPTVRRFATTMFVGAALLVACDQAAGPASRGSPRGPTHTISGVEVSSLDGTVLDPPCLPVFAPTWTLLADCTTMVTIQIPPGGTVEGNGHTITAVDPPLGFHGAVLKGSSGSTANVNNLGVTTSLTDAFGCFGGDDRLRGILFDGVSGNITNSRIITIKRGLSSGCQEGNGIELRNFDGTGVKTVMIDNNVVRDYQKNGITANGDVAVTITSNTVQGAGRVDYIAQNGIQFGFGATGTVVGNSITDNFYTGCSNRDAAKTGCTPYVAAGLLLYDIDPSTVRRSNNTYRNNQFNVLLVTHQSLDS